MLTSRHMTVEAEFLHWLILLVAALALLLAVASVLAADPMGEKLMPAHGPQGFAATAPDRRERLFFPENPPPSPRAAVDVAARLWMTLEHQQAGCAAEALAGWQEMRLEPDAAVWPEIGMAAA